jgi:competence protein ComEC
MGTLSIVSVPANLLVLPLVPVLMATAALTALLGFTFSALAFVPAVASSAVAGYMFAVVTSLSDLPFATITVPPFSIWVVIAVYLMLTLVVLRLQRTPTYEQLAPPV